MVPPFFHETPGDVSTWAFKKSGNSPVCIAAWTGVSSPSDFDSTEFSTLFNTDFEDRGTNNLLKRQYMSAVTCDKLGFYEPILASAFDQLIAALDSGTPVLSTWGELVVTLFLDLHYGQVDHPDWLREYAKGVLDFMAHFGRGKFDGNSCKDFNTLGVAACQAREVLEYTKDRIDEIVENEDKATFTFWWIEAGLPEDKVIQEVLHNAIAFNQLISTVYLVVAAKIYGRLSATSLAVGPELGPQIDFFQKYQEARNAAGRLDVIREAWRLLVPNNLWTSRLEDASNFDNNADIEDYDNFDFRGVGFIPFIVQAINDGYSPDPSTGFSTTAYTYGTDRYDDFRINSGAASGNAVSCPFLQGKGPNPPNKNRVLGPEDFAPSSVDGETMIPHGHDKIIPVFENPKYCPFGLGYRRCPAEVFNNMLMDLLLDKLGTSGLEFEFPQGKEPTLDELIRGVPCDKGDPDVVPGGISCRANNLFVV